MNRKIQQHAAKSETFFLGHLHMRHSIVLPLEVALLGQVGSVYVTTLTNDKGVFGYIVSPDGLDMIIDRIELSLRTMAYVRTVEQYDWMVIAAHYGLGALNKVPVKDSTIAPPATHLLAPPGPLWFSLREGYAIVSSDPANFREHDVSPQLPESTAAGLVTSRKVLSSRRTEVPRRTSSTRKKVQETFGTGPRRS